MSVIQPKRLSYTRRDILSLHDDVDLYIKQFIPRVTDVSQANTGRIFLTVVEALIDNLNFSVDQAKLESSLSDARQRKNVIKQARWYNPTSISSATVDITFTMLTGVAAPGGYAIPIYTRLQTSTTPTLEFITSAAATILAGTTSIIQSAIQGYRVAGESLTAAATGSPNQIYVLANPKTPHDYIEVYVDAVLVSPMVDFAEANSDEIVYTLRFDESDYTYVIFGDGEFGKCPPAGSAITVTYIRSEGDFGNATPNTITRVIGAVASDIGATNVYAASGGAASESNTSIKRVAPAVARSFYRAVTAPDYEVHAEAVAGVYSAFARFAEGARTDVYIMPDGGGVASAYLVNLVQADLDSRKLEGAVPIVHSLYAASVYVVVNLVTFNNRVAKSAIKKKARDGTVAALDYTRIKAGRGFTLSDLAGIYESLDNGTLIDYADFIVLTRIPRIAKSNAGAPDFQGRIVLNSLIDYDTWLITAVSANQYVIAKNGTPQTTLGTVAIEYSSDSSEVTFTLGIVGDVLTIGDTWLFSTSRYCDNLLIGDDEFMQLESEGDLVFAVFYPGEYDLKTKSAI